MKIFHICSDYFGTRIYSNLLDALSAYNNIKHTMYVPLATSEPTGRHAHEDLPNGSSDLVYSKDFNWYDRLLYNRKRHKIACAIHNRFNPKEIDIIHAHSLFSAGGVADLFYNKYGTQYIAAIRNSDVNVFFRYGLHIRSFGLKIIKNAKKLIFLSPSYRDSLLEKYVPGKLQPEILNKSVVIPNGIDDFWLKNTFFRIQQKPDRQIRLLFVGELQKNKNVETCIRVAHELCKKEYDSSLTVVGDGPEGNAIKKLAAESGIRVRFYGWLNSKEELLKEYRAAHIFIMLSIKETFGLSYIEAMSQGLPVLYTKGQGIDGYFTDGLVGFSCSTKEIQTITEKVLRIVSDYDRLSANATKCALEFSWKQIATRYHDIYSSAL